MKGDYLFTHKCDYRQEGKVITKRNVLVSILGSTLYFALQKATSHDPIYDRTRICDNSMKEILNKYKQLKQEEQ